MRAVNTSEGFLELSHTDNLAAAYVPILILLILGYVLQGIDGSIQTLQPYKMLYQGGSAVVVACDSPPTTLLLSALAIGLFGMRGALLCSLVL